jgi:predicted ATPase
MKIAISGSHGTGKTTLLNSLDLSDHTKLSELARAVAQELNKPPQDLNPEELREFQWTLFNRQSKLEDENEHFVVDRSIYDILAYSADIPVVHELIAILKKQPRYYDIVFFLPIEFELELDGWRHHDKVYQQKIGDRILDYLKEFGVNYHVITGSLEERLEKMQTIIAQHPKKHENKK